MNSRLQSLFDSLEKKKHEVLAAIQHVSDEDFSKRSDPDKWSISEILAHLQTSESLSTQYIIKKSQGLAEAENTTLKHDVLMVLVKISQRLPFKFRAPNVVTTNTPAYATKKELITHWDKTRQQIKELLEKFSEDQIKKQIYRHPRIGLINIQHGLIFFREHIIHHYPQVKRQIKP